MQTIIHVTKTGHAIPRRAVILPPSEACKYRVTATRGENTTVRFYRNKAVAIREARVLSGIADSVAFTVGDFNVIPDLIYG